jgi:hypothetical protein
VGARGDDKQRPAPDARRRSRVLDQLEAFVAEDHAAWRERQIAADSERRLAGGRRRVATAG